MFRYILAALLLVSPLSFINAKGNGAELAVHLLSYLSQDYGEAVSQGEVTSQGEYDEQVEFINEVSRISNQANFDKKLESDVEELSVDGAGAAAVAVPASASVGFAVVQPLTTKTIANTARRILTALKGLFIRPLAGSVFL